MWKRQADGISSIHTLYRLVVFVLRVVCISPGSPLRFKITERASLNAGSVDLLQHSASAVVEEGKGPAAKAYGGDREKKTKRTERLRNLERELKRSAQSAQATTVQMSFADAADTAGAEDEQRVCRVAAAPRIRISGFSYGLGINGVYEETREVGKGGRLVLQHVDDGDLCLEWLNGECGGAVVITILRIGIILCDITPPR